MKTLNVTPMNYKIAIQRHAKVSDFIGHNDMIVKTEQEKENATKLYKTIVLEKVINHIFGVYVYATTLDDTFIGGLVYGDGKLYDYTHSEMQHNQVLDMFKN